MNYLKWALGVQNIDWFVSNGNPISSNTFNVTETGIHTIYYETINGEKRVYTFNVTQNDLPATGVHYQLSWDETGATYIVNYGNDATSLLPVEVSTTGSVNWNGWDDRFPFNQIKPCVMKNGAVQYYLNPNDFSKKENGETANIGSDQDGDVMIEFPKIYWKFNKTSTRITVDISNTALDESYKATAFIGKDNVEKNKLYIGAYPLYQTNATSPLQSISGKIPTRFFAEDKRSILQESHEDFTYISFHSASMLRVLYILLFQSLETVKLGKGRITLTDAQNTTGSLDANGMIYGRADTNFVMIKFLGLENLWGGYLFHLDGIGMQWLFGGTKTVLISPNNADFNRNFTGYLDTGINMTSLVNKTTKGNILTMSAHNDYPFIPLTTLSTPSKTGQYASTASVVGTDGAFYWGGGHNDTDGSNKYGLFYFTNTSYQPAQRKQILL